MVDSPTEQPGAGDTPDSQRASNAGSPPGRRHRVAGYVKAIAAFITFACTVGGVYLAYQARQQPFTLTDWKRQAQAACERDGSDLVVPMSDAVGALYRVVTALQAQVPAAQTSGDRQLAAHNLASVAGAFGKVVGDLEGIKLPSDGIGQVRAALQEGTRVHANLLALASQAQTVLLGVPDASGRPFAAVMTLMASTVNTTTQSSLPSWNRAISSLGLDQCPFYGYTPQQVHASALPTSPWGSPSSQPPSPPPSQPGGLTFAERSLVERLDAGVLSACTARTDEETRGVVSAVNCTAPAGASKRPLVVGFGSQDSANSWFQRLSGSTPSRGFCGPGGQGYQGQWTHNGRQTGPFACEPTSSGVRMIWVIADAQIGFIADGTDYATLNAWFKDYAYAIS